jgi:hypothetical protein
MAQQIKIDAFASSTELRFLIFILASIGQSWILAHWIAKTLYADPTPAQTLDISIYCIASTLAISALCYLAHPAIVIKREKLEKIDVKDSQLNSYIVELSRQMNIPPPKLYASKKCRHQNAKVFGIGKHKILKLDLGLILIRNRNPELFGAIIRHELSHIKNQDVSKGLFSRYLFLVTMTLTVPFMIINCGIFLINIWYGIPRLLAASALANSLSYDIKLIIYNIYAFFRSLLPFLPLQLVMLAEYSAMIRSREYYADWQASIEGAKPALEHIFSHSENLSHEGFFRNIFRKHPTFAQRLSFLSNPASVVLNTSHMDIFLVSMTGYTVLLAAQRFLTLLRNNGISDPNLVEFITGKADIGFYFTYMILLLLIMAIIVSWGSIILRFSVYEWINRTSTIKSCARICGLGMVATVGFIGGELCWPTTMERHLSLSGLVEKLKDPLQLALCIIISFYTAFFLMKYSLPRSNGGKPPRMTFILIIGAAFVQLNLLLQLTTVYFYDSEYQKLQSAFAAIEVEINRSEIYLITVSWLITYTLLAWLLIWISIAKKSKILKSERRLHWLNEIDPSD